VPDQTEDQDQCDPPGRSAAADSATAGSSSSNASCSGVRKDRARFNQRAISRSRSTTIWAPALHRRQRTALDARRLRARGRRSSSRRSDRRYLAAAAAWTLPAPRIDARHAGGAVHDPARLAQPSQELAISAAAA
jgi:hypothetical protein